MEAADLPADALRRAAELRSATSRRNSFSERSTRKLEERGVGPRGGGKERGVQRGKILPLSVNGAF